MEKQVVLISGGARSGKSRYAEERAGGLGTRLLYLATGQAGDKEMEERIAEHRKRRGEKWITVEEPLELTRELGRHRGRVDCALVDCLTLWITNLLIQRGVKGLRNAAEGLIKEIPRLDFHLFLVTNEVGWGIVPDSPLARQFRDLSGWINQQVGAAANEIILMVAGVPLTVKKAGG